MTKEFERAVAGIDRCDLCGFMQPLVYANDMAIGILLEIMPDGQPELVCWDCFNSEGHEFVLGGK